MCKRSTDFGNTWTNIYAPTGLVVAQVQHMTIAMRDSVDTGHARKRGLFLGTRGTGVWVYDIDDPPTARRDADGPITFAASIAPNPAHGHVDITLQLPEAASVQLSISDVLGRIVRKREFPEHRAGSFTTRQSLHGLRSGVYFCTVVTASNARTLRFVIGR